AMRPKIRLAPIVIVMLPVLALAQYGRPGRNRAPAPRGVPGEATPLVSMRGVLRSIGKKDLTIDAGDDQILTFKRTKKTRFLKGDAEIKPEAFPDGAKVFVEASRAPNGDLDAVNVFLGEPPTSKSKTP